MKKLIVTLGAAILLAGCATTGGGGVSDKIPYIAAINVELGAQARCPATPLQWGALDSARLTFDTVYGLTLTPDQQVVLVAIRVATDKSCPRAVA